MTNEQEANEMVYGGYIRGQLSAAFDKVKSQKGWKWPIKATILVGEMNVVQTAICFYAGGGASFSKPINGKVRVSAPGYYAIIGA